MTASWRVLAPVVLAAAFCFAGTDAARAATVSVRLWSDVANHGSQTTVAEVTLEASAGEVNDLTVARPSSETLEFRDAGTGLAAGAGCTAIDERSVRCSIPSVDQRAVRLQLGDLDDRLRIRGALGSWHLLASGGDGDDELDVTGAFETGLGPGLSGDAGADRLSGSSGNDLLVGGEGDDSLSGGPGSDRLTGGFGTDSMDGGSGPDLVDYGERQRPVTVDLSRAAPQGESGEGDTIRNIERVHGGDGSDVLLGSAGANALVASRDDRQRGPGDTVDGRGGADAIYGSAGPDELRGGPGNDELYGGGGGDRLLAGPGRDRVYGSPPASKRDGVRCGPGRDLLVLGGRTRDPLVRPACEALDVAVLHVAAWTLKGSVLELRLVPGFDHGRCRVSLRTGADVRRVRLRPRSRRSVRLATHDTTANVRVAIDFRCFDVGRYRGSARLTFGRHHR